MGSLSFQASREASSVRRSSSFIGEASFSLRLQGFRSLSETMPLMSVWATAHMMRERMRNRRIQWHAEDICHFSYCQCTMSIFVHSPR